MGRAWLDGWTWRNESAEKENTPTWLVVSILYIHIYIYIYIF